MRGKNTGGATRAAGPWAAMAGAGRRLHPGRAESDRDRRAGKGGFQGRVERARLIRAGSDGSDGSGRTGQAGRAVPDGPDGLGSLEEDEWLLVESGAVGGDGVLRLADALEEPPRLRWRRSVRFFRLLSRGGNFLEESHARRVGGRESESGGEGGEAERK